MDIRKATLPEIRAQIAIIERVQRSIGLHGRNRAYLTKLRRRRAYLEFHLPQQIQAAREKHEELLERLYGRPPVAMHDFHD
jgi:hypothetical protein